MSKIEENRGLAEPVNQGFPQIKRLYCFHALALCPQSQKNLGGDQDRQELARINDFERWERKQLQL